MQIRKQLRKMALAMARIKEEYLKCCWERTCKDGYHGIHPKVRWKSRARDHGTKVGQAGRKQK